MSTRHNFCQVRRRKLVRLSVVNLATGESTPTGTEWREGPCDTPLFTDHARELGQCASCMSGWTHPENYPLPAREVSK